jgi:hypothetical protein
VDYSSPVYKFEAFVNKKYIKAECQDKKNIKAECQDKKTYQSGMAR